MVTIDIPDDIGMLQLETAELPLNWNTFPHLRSTQVIGDKFVHDGAYCILHLPSAVTQGDFNVLINPYHPDFQRIRRIGSEPFPFDKRIFVCKK